MALKKGGTPAAQPGGFEQEPGNTAVADKPVAGIDAAAEAAASAGATTAIAKAAGTSLAATKGKFVSVFVAYKNALPPIPFDSLVRLVGSNGQVMDGDKKLLGASATLQLISWNDQFVISPGSDTAEAKEAVRYSSDGKTVDDTGESVTDYLKQLREVGGYEKASVKQYAELVGILVSCEKPSDHVGNMVQVSLSPKARAKWEGFQLQQSIKVHTGQMTAEAACNVILRAEVKTNSKNQTFTLLQTSDK